VIRKEKTLEEQIKLFAISNQLLENELDKVEAAFGIDLGREHEGTIEIDKDYYPQLDRKVRQEAAEMSKHYEIFYSLEKSIRSLISETLVAAVPAGWWESGRVPQQIRRDAEARMAREIDAGITPRSPEPIDFTNFGELGEIIKANRDVFGSIFPSQKAVERVLASLNTLRGSIAHCSPLAEDEVVRLRLSVRDWFRLME
jgi:HEPN superfamily Swt1-like protein